MRRCILHICEAAFPPQVLQFLQDLCCFYFFYGAGAADSLAAGSCDQSTSSLIQSDSNRMNICLCSPAGAAIFVFAELRSVHKQVGTIGKELARVQQEIGTGGPDGKDPSAGGCVVLIALISPS